MLLLVLSRTEKTARLNFPSSLSASITHFPLYYFFVFCVARSVLYFRFEVTHIHSIQHLLRGANAFLGTPSIFEMQL